MSVSVFSVLMGSLIGAALGSFAGVALERGWPALRSQGASAALRAITFPPSHCPACETPLRPRDNLPLVSFLVLQGRCAHCGVSIPVRLFLLEALFALTGAGIALGLAGFA